MKQGHLPRHPILRRGHRHHHHAPPPVGSFTKHKDIGYIKYILVL